jgi:YebC/PmpR family DNA-binding regulatory protein
MSGHNKWSKIHRQKGAADNKRGNLFTKLANAITVSAKQGGGDPVTNFKLQLAIDKAKSANMPKENIERAIKRGTGELASDKLETLMYEGFGPAGIAILIEALTDNRNRTSASIKHLLSKYGGGLGGPNTVAWMFEVRGVIHVNQLVSEELELDLIDKGALDFVNNNNETTILTTVESLQNVKNFLAEKNINIDQAEIEYIPKEKKHLEEEDAQKLERLMAELDDNEDVNNIYVTAE